MSDIIEQTRADLAEPDDDDASDSGESTGPAAEEGKTSGSAEAPNRYEKLERLKREKRLAMNRDCARARRRRKKHRMELLECRVQELTRQSVKMQEANNALKARAAQLEVELGIARSGMALGISAPDVMPTPSSFLAARMQGLSADAIAEKLNLQRRAALVGLGGATTGLGGLPGNGGFHGAGAGNSNMDALRYMQLMQAKNAMVGEPGMQNLSSGAFGQGGRGMHHGPDYQGNRPNNY
jgi:bZIP transcription factor